MNSSNQDYDVEKALLGTLKDITSNVATEIKSERKKTQLKQIVDQLEEMSKDTSIKMEPGLLVKS